MFAMNVLMCVCDVGREGAARDLLCRVGGSGTAVKMK